MIRNLNFCEMSQCFLTTGYVIGCYLTAHGIAASAVVSNVMPMLQWALRAGMIAGGPLEDNRVAQQGHESCRARLSAAMSKELQQGWLRRYKRR